MSDKLKHEIDKIELPTDLHERSKKGIMKAKSEMPKRKKQNKIVMYGLAAGLVALIGTYSVLNMDKANSTAPTTSMINEDGSVEIPKIQLPENSESANMIGLIVYKGKIYTQSRTEIDAKDAKALVGEKLGTTKGTIDEWSSQDAYAEEFASTAGITDVYSVKGYDKDFRIMTFMELEGEIFAEFYECLNGITVKSGSDVFGKLKMDGNIVNAQYRTFSNWDNSIDKFQEIEDMNLLLSFVQTLNEAKPLVRSENSDPIGELRSDESFRELTLSLKDGSKVHLTLLKGGYIYYGFMDVYFQMDQADFMKIWEQLT